MPPKFAFSSDRLGACNAGSFVPRYVQLADRLSRLIQEQGDKVVGKALPSEAQCAEAFAVSRPTVRQAMDRLASQGLIKREKGRGTFVTRPRLAHDVSHDFDDEMRSNAHRVSYQVLSWERAKASPDAVRAFSTGDARDLYLLRRLRAVDAVVVGVEERFIPAAVASRFAAARLETDSIFELVRQSTEPIAHIDVEVSARAADAEAARLMKVKAGTPLLVRASTLRGAGGRALVHGTTTFLAEHYAFRFTVSFSGRATWGGAEGPGNPGKTNPGKTNPSKRSPR
jgi:GntR family transcriptional regulator